MLKSGHNPRWGWGDLGRGWGSLLGKGPGGGKGVGCVLAGSTRRGYQSVLLESRLMGQEGDLAVTPGSFAVRIPRTLELQGPALPLVQWHSSPGAKRLWSQGDGSPQACDPPHPPPSSLCIRPLPGAFLQGLAVHP